MFRKYLFNLQNEWLGEGSGSMPVETVEDYIPLKVNAAGVMPIIFAQAIMFLPLTAAQYVMGHPSLGTWTDENTY